MTVTCEANDIRSALMFNFGLAWYNRARAKLRAFEATYNVDDAR